MELDKEEETLINRRARGSTDHLNVVKATLLVVGAVLGSGIVTLPHCIAIAGQ